MVYLETPLPSTGGHAKPSLIEISGAQGSGKTEILLRLLAHQASGRIAWVEEALTLYPCALAQAQISLERVLFVDCPKASGEALWAAHQMVRSQIFAAVVLGQCGAVSETDLRRLQLSVERNQTSVFLLTERPMRRAWPISLQLEVRREKQGPVAKVLRSRGGGVPWLLPGNGSLAS